MKKILSLCLAVLMLFAGTAVPGFAALPEGNLDLAARISVVSFTWLVDGVESNQLLPGKIITAQIDLARTDVGSGPQSYCLLLQVLNKGERFDLQMTSGSIRVEDGIQTIKANSIALPAQTEECEVSAFLVSKLGKDAVPLAGSACFGSNDADLYSLQIAGESVPLTVGKTEYHVDLTVREDKLPLNISAVSRDLSSKVTIQDIGEGTSGTAVVTVTSHDGSVVKTFTIHITAEIVKEEWIKAIFLNGVALEDFKPDGFAYTIDGYDRLPVVTWEPALKDTTVTVEVEGEEGEAQNVILTATSVNGKTQDYILSFSKYMEIVPTYIGQQTFNSGALSNTTPTALLYDLQTNGNTFEGGVSALRGDFRVYSMYNTVTYPNGYHDQNALSAFMIYDLSDIPADASITDASCILTINEKNTSSPAKMDVYRWESSLEWITEENRNVRLTGDTLNQAYLNKVDGKIPLNTSEFTQIGDSASYRCSLNPSGIAVGGLFGLDTRVGRDNGKNFYVKAGTAAPVLTIQYTKPHTGGAEPWSASIPVSYMAVSSDDEDTDPDETENYSYMSISDDNWGATNEQIAFVYSEEANVGNLNVTGRLGTDFANRNVILFLTSVTDGKIYGIWQDFCDSEGKYSFEELFFAPAGSYQIHVIADTMTAALNSGSRTVNIKGAWTADPTAKMVIQTAPDGSMTHYLEVTGALSHDYAAYFLLLSVRGAGTDPKQLASYRMFRNIVVNGDGTFRFFYPFQAPTGTYDVTLMTNRMDEPKICSVSVYDVAKIQTLLMQLNNKSIDADALRECLDEQWRDLGLDGIIYAQLSPSARLAVSNQILAYQDTYTHETLQELFRDAVILCGLEKEEKQAVFAEILEYYSKDPLALEKEPLYIEFTELSDRSNVYSGMMREEYSSLKDVGTAFNRNVVFGLLKEVSSSLQITGLLSNYDEWHSFDLTNSVYRTYSQKAANYIADHLEEYDSLDQIIDKLNDIVKNPKAYFPDKQPAASSKNDRPSVGSIGLNSGVAQTQRPSTYAPETAGFIDVPKGYWGEPAISYLIGKNVISGRDAQHFCPEEKVTRAEFAKLFVSAFSFETSFDDVPFADVGSEQWYYPFVSSGAKNGIIFGNDGYFFPDEVITRQDAAVLLKRAMEKKNLLSGETNTLGFFDKGDISSYALEAVEAFSGTIIKGFEDNTFRPFANLTRAEAAQLIYNALIGIE